MTIPDLINGAYEALGGLFLLNNCRVLYRDKKVRGVSIVTNAVFTSWGFWNLYYYPHLDQWISFAGGLTTVTANCLWLRMWLKYRTGAE